MTKLLGLSGKKQAGKNSIANWIIGQQMCAVDMVSWIKIDSKGRLIVPAVVDDELTEGVFDPLSVKPEVQNLLSQYVWPVVKLYSFADILKLSCVAIFGLEYKQMNGTDEQKNSPTKFKWDDFDHVLLDKTRDDIKDKGIWDEPMTGRHILQVMGTDIFRSIYGNVWVDACIRNIQDDNVELAIIIDCRFPNEVKGIQDAGGKVVRLTRAPFKDTDTHVSETALDGYVGYDFILDNENIDIPQQNEQINKMLKEWDYNTWDWELKEEE